MKTVKFQDLSRQEIQVSLSGSGDYRVYVDNEGEAKNMCLHMNRHQANILIAALEDLFSLEED